VIVAAGKRERTKASNRAAILDAARDVFAELGYDAATIRDIVRRTDLASGTFYNYFSDKESVLRALLEHSAREWRRRVRQARTEARTLEDFVGGGFRAFFGFIADDPTLFAVLRRNAPIIRALVADPMLGAGLDELLADLRSAMERGSMPPIDPEYMTAAMAGVGFEVGIRMVEREPVDVEGATAFATALFLGGTERMGAAAQPAAESG
jgi:AcrR family transcriptional regulator